MSEIVTISLGDIIEMSGKRFKLASAENGIARLEFQDDGEKRTFQTTYKAPAGTPQTLILAAVYLAQVWCRNVQRITVLNQNRFSVILARIRDGYKATDCEEAIKLYGRDEWHRKNKTWLDIAKFFTPEKLDRWILRIQERKLAAEIRGGKTPPADPKVRGLIGCISGAKAVRTEEDELLDRYNKRSIESRLALIQQAIREHLEINPHRARHLASDINNKMVRDQVFVILRREPQSC